MKFEIRSKFFRFWGGILKLSDLDSLTVFIFRGGYSETFGFGLSDNFHFGGYSETLRFGLSDNFHFRGGGSETVLQNRGYSGRIWTKISTTPAGSCITDSLSHTTYVETNKEFSINAFSANCYQFYIIILLVNPFLLPIFISQRKKVKAQ